MSLLFEPLKWKGMELKNRIVMPPMANGKATPEGHVTQEMVNYYRERAQHGIALVIVEHSYVNSRGKAHEGQMGIHNDKTMDGLTTLVKTIKECGSAAVIQITHAGSQIEYTPSSFHPPLSASSVVNPALDAGPMPDCMSLQEIEAVTDDFYAAAVRAKEAGFDGVEIHGAHGYLLNQFYSPLTNLRQDQYGGTRDKRLALALELVSRVRQAVGSDFPILYRLGVEDGMPGGLSLEDGVYAAMRLEKAGVDLLDISGGMLGSRAGRSGPAYFEFASAAVKEMVTAPVLVTGGITDPHEAEKVLENKSADLIGVGRALLQDPLWAMKAQKKLVG